MEKEELLKKFPKIKDIVMSENYVALSINQKLFRYEIEAILPIFEYLYERGRRLKVFEQDLNKIVVIFERGE